MLKPENIKLANEPAPGDKWVMECTLLVERGGARVKFDGFAAKDVVDKFLDIARRVALDETARNESGGR